MTSKALQKNISFSLKFQMLQAKMNLYLNLPIYSNVAAKVNLHLNLRVQPYL